MRVILVYITILFATNPLWAQRPVASLVDTKVIDLNPHLSYFIDEKGKMTYEEVSKLGTRQFTPFNDDGFRLEATKATVWLTFDIKNLNEYALQYILEFIDPTIYDITLYTEYRGGLIVARGGAGLTQNERQIPGNRLAFRIPVEGKAQQRVFIKTQFVMKTTFNAKLLTEKTFFAKQSKERFFIGLFYGSMFLVLVYSILLLITTRLRLFAYYAGYVFAVAVLTGAGDGITAEFLHFWVEWKQGLQDAASTAIANILAMMFTIAFLEIKSWSKRVYFVAIIYTLLTGFISLILLLLHNPIIFDVLSIASLIQIVFTIYAGVRGVKNRIPQAGFFLWANIAHGFFIVFFTLSMFRVIPYNFLAQYAIHLAYGSSAIILSYGLGVRMYSFYKKLLEQEVEKQEIIKQKNEELEEQVTIRTNYLTEKEGNLRSILDNHNNAIWLIDEQYQLIEFNTVFNRDWEMAYGKSLERGKSMVEQIPIHNLKSLWKVRFDAALDGEPGVYQDTYTLDNQRHIYEIRTFPIIQDKKVRGVSLFSANITERINAQNQLKEQNEMLKKVNQELDRFVYSASHDLKAPLASVLGLINIAKLEKDENARHQYYEMMAVSIARLDQFIKDIVDYSRNARLELEYKKVDIKEVIQSSFEDLKFAIEDKQLTPKINIESKAELYTDEVRLRMIVRNLLSNALKYGCTSPTDNVINIDAKVTEEKLNFSITDFGPGIDKKHHEALFDMFYRATEISMGTGLGLYIVKETVEKLSGKVAIDSELGKGATFIVELPNEFR